MNGTSAYQRFGRFMTPIIERQLTLTAMNGVTFDLHDVVKADTGNAPWLLECVTAEQYAVSRLKNVVVREYYDSGSASVKLQLRLWFVRNTFSGVAAGVVRRLPALYEVLGYVDINTADYVDYDNDAVTTTGYSIASKACDLPIISGAHKDTYVVVTANEGTKSYADAAAALYLSFIFEQH